MCHKLKCCNSFKEDSICQYFDGNDIVTPPNERPPNVRQLLQKVTYLEK